MQYRFLGRSPLRVSAVGLGTCQLRLVPRRQALATLRTGFDHGINIVHTAPDYEGAEDLVAEAVRESGRDIVVLSQGHGDEAHFAWLFDIARRRYDRDCLDAYGIACIDDREFLGEDVWGPRGMVEFLRRKKHQGQIRATFCTTHGDPEYVAKLILSGAFDAIMLACNPLGFHLLSYNPGGARTFENIPANNQRILPLAAKHGVGVIVMKPLAGGLLTHGKAFPPRHEFHSTCLAAGDVLKAILRRPEVTCVMPGAASPEEAAENALAGGDDSVGPDVEARVNAISATLSGELCSRCGICDAACSRHLPVSWLFRDAYISNYPSETFETVDNLQYFHLHPGEVAACSTCDDVTCLCPAGIDIPRSLIEVHERMRRLREQGVLPGTPAMKAVQRCSGTFPLRLVQCTLRATARAEERAGAVLWIENLGSAIWRAKSGGPGPVLHLAISVNGRWREDVSLRHDVEPGTRTHLAFEIGGHPEPGDYEYTFTLNADDDDDANASTVLTRHILSVEPANA